MSRGIGSQRTVPTPTSTTEGHLSHPSRPGLSKQKHMAPHMANLISLLSQEELLIGSCRLLGQISMPFLGLNFERQPDAWFPRDRQFIILTTLEPVLVPEGARAASTQHPLPIIKVMTLGQNRCWRGNEKSKQCQTGLERPISDSVPA